MVFHADGPDVHDGFGLRFVIVRYPRVTGIVVSAFGAFLRIRQPCAEALMAALSRCVSWYLRSFCDAFATGIARHQPLASDPPTAAFGGTSTTRGTTRSVGESVPKRSLGTRRVENPRSGGETFRVRRPPTAACGGTSPTRGEAFLGIVWAVRTSLCSATLQVTEQVTDLRLGQFFEHAFRHQRSVGGLGLFDQVAGDWRFLTIAVDQCENAVVLVDDQAGENSAVLEGDRLRLKFLADLALGSTRLVRRKSRLPRSAPVSSGPIDSPSSKSL